MRGFRHEGICVRATRTILAPFLVLALLMTVLVTASVGVGTTTAQARGPAYDGPQTGFQTPAYFGPAPNVYPYCESPTYFDPFPENVNSIGSMVEGDTASVTTDGITMDLEITSKGVTDPNDPEFIYPGFFDTDNDQAKGIELAEGDGARVTLSAPLFYSQWIFTDVDQPSEGFTVTPSWTVPGEAAVFGGDENFTFAGSTRDAVQLDDTDGQSTLSQQLEGRVQVDFLGAVTGIEMLRTFPSNGQSGFAVGGGCEAAGAAKTATSDAVWNGTGWDVTYELRMANNLPSAATIQAVIDDAIAAPGASMVTGAPQGIDISLFQLTDDLSDPAYSSIVVTDRSATGNLVLNPNYNGLDDIELIQSGSIAAESQELITISVTYTPDLTQNLWTECSTGYIYFNQTEITGEAAGVPFSDLSDAGVDPSPGADNGNGGVDDVTEVFFPCPPGDLQIVKTALAGAGATCPTFANGVAGEGDPVQLTRGDIVTYCISVFNGGPGDITGVEVTDPQAPLPSIYTLDLLEAGTSRTFSYEREVDLGTPERNTATATGTDSLGAIDPVSDDALIAVADRLQPVLEIVKTVVAGGTDCPSFEMGVVGIGPALQVTDTATVTYCISVENVGQGPATNVQITDLQAPEVYDIGTLLPGQGADRQYDRVVTTTTPTENVATVDYLDADSQQQSASDNAQIAVAPLEPNLEIVKTVLAGADTPCPAFIDGEPGLGDPLAVDDGGTVTYCVTVRNTGPGIATDVVVSDTQVSGDFPVGTLGDGDFETFTYNVTVDLDTEPVNTASVNGNGPSGALDEETDQAQIAISRLPDPLLEIVKTAVFGPNGTCPTFTGGTSGLGDPVRFVEGQTVTYCIFVRNVGQGAATGVVITDPQAPDTVDLFVGDMGVGAGAQLSYDVLLDANSERSITNVATVNGSGPNGVLEPVSDPALVEVAKQPDPVLEIVKTAITGPDGACPDTFEGGVQGAGPALMTKIGDTVTYCLALRNTGDGTATDVRIDDDQAPQSPIEIGELAVGETRFMQYDVVVSADTNLVNTAVATGNGPNGSVSDDDDSLIALDERVANIILVHSVSRADEDCITESKALNSLVANVEDLPITWCAEITNSGNVPLTNVTLTAPDLGITDPVDALEGTGVAVLLRGQSVVLRFDGLIPEGGLLSTGTATGDPSDESGNLIDLPSPSDVDTAEVREASINLETTVVAGADGDCTQAVEEAVVAVGDDITWCFEVTNTGATDLWVDEVVDVTLGIMVPVPENQRQLSPGATILVSVNDVAAEGGMVNDAEVLGQPLDTDGSILEQSPTVRDEDPATVRTPVADLSIIKSVSASLVTQGEPLTYTLLVTNDGPDAAADVMVRDSLPAGLSYTSVPGAEGWACALDQDERGFSCSKASPMSNGESAELTYTVTTSTAAAGTAHRNVAGVESTTTDPDLSNNEDDETIETEPPLGRRDDPDPLEYPGPFTQPEPPDEVLGLAITGAASNLLSLLSAAMISIGGVLSVAARRSRRED